MKIPSLFPFWALLSLQAHSQTLDQQERCAQQARRAFQQIQAEAKIADKKFGTHEMSSDYQSHYNTKIGKCLMFVESMDSVGEETSTTAYLIDANERRQYAYYLWMTKKDKNIGRCHPRVAN